MIFVDEEYSAEDPEPDFPYRYVKTKHNVNPKTDYDILSEQLGKGAFGTVYLCKEKTTSSEFAAKFVTCNRKEDRRNMEREIEIMTGLHHPRIIQLYDAFDDGKTICVILELILGGELFERIIDDEFILTEKSCTCFMRQIVDGVGYIHSQNIIHLDLKPENILCLTKTGNRIKIIDFGMARRYDPDKKLQVLFGTPEFTAPEVVNFDEIRFYTDMWSLGVICYVLLSGFSPFVGDTDLDTMTNVTLGKYDFTDEAFLKISEEAKDFIKNLLVKDGSKRLKASEALDHPWLKKLAPTTDLSETKAKLKRYVIKKRWIKAVNTIIALRRMGIDFKQKLINLDGLPIKLQIWDTAGQERFRTLTTAYYRGAMGILLMYDVTSLESYNNLSYWLRNIQENASPDVVKVLAGNKCECSPTQRMVDKDRGEKIAENFDMPFFEVSCKQDINIEDAFLTLARKIREQREHRGENFDTDDKGQEKKSPGSNGLGPFTLGSISDNSRCSC